MRFSRRPKICRITLGSVMKETARRLTPHFLQINAVSPTFPSGGAGVQFTWFGSQREVLLPWDFPHGRSETSQEGET